MNATIDRHNDQRRLRVVWSVLLGLALLASAFAPSVPAQAQTTQRDDYRYIERRIYILIKSITIIEAHDNYLDLNGAKPTFHVLFREVLPDCPPFLPIEQCKAPTLIDHTIAVSASDGDVLSMSQVIPDADSIMDDIDRQVDPRIGIPLFADESYVLRISGQERDLIRTEQLGTVTLHLTPENDWHRGEHRIRASKGGGETTNGDYIVELEIRDMPLPDLRPVGLKVVNGPDSAQQTVCVDIVNAGVVDAAHPFDVVFHVDSGVMLGGRRPTDKLPPGEHVEPCVSIDALADGQHIFRVFVDTRREVAEISDSNNAMEVPFTTTAPSDSGSDPSPVPSPMPSPMPMPSPTPATGKADLTVSTLKVNGRVPDGKDDCKDGKNTVTVRVKNQGTTKASDVIVRLVVDDAQADAEEQQLDGLDAGKETTVSFDGVRLKKGPHSLTAMADATNGIAESDESNNTLKVTARCNDDD